MKQTRIGLGYDINEGAMYDRISNKIFRNNGTGMFLLGNDKVRTN